MSGEIFLVERHGLSTHVYSKQVHR
jgi:hypothetical protein